MLDLAPQTKHVGNRGTVFFLGGGGSEENNTAIRHEGNSCLKIFVEKTFFLVLVG